MEAIAGEELGLQKQLEIAKRYRECGTLLSRMSDLEIMQFHRSVPEKATTEEFLSALQNLSTPAKSKKRKKLNDDENEEEDTWENSFPVFYQRIKRRFLI